MNHQQRYVAYDPAKGFRISGTATHVRFRYKSPRTLIFHQVYGRNGLEQTAFFLLCTKAAQMGEDVYWSAQLGPSDPLTLPANHFTVDNLSSDNTVSHTYRTRSVAHSPNHLFTNASRELALFQILPAIIALITSISSMIRLNFPELKAPINFRSTLK